jgi:hypothetical protein
MLFSFCLFAHSSTCWCLLIISCLCSFRVSAENTGVSLVPLQPDDEDPLMVAVNFLESNWISV